MKAIKCPNCGSEQVKELTEEKYACMACDNVFLIHNHSKEFRKTDEHISSMHQDLKDDISKLMNSNNIDPDAIIEKAEQHLKKKDWDIASDLYDKATQENPDKSKAWYGLYRALTGDFEAVDRYALFVCDGNYFDDDDKEMGSQSFFYGNGFISRALDCPDSDKTGIIDNVTAFIKKCAEYGKKDIEDSIKELLEGFESMRKDLDSQRDIVKKEKKKDKTKAFIPAIIVLALLAVCVWYFFASGDWLGKVLGVAGVVLVLKFGGKFIGRSFSNAKAEGVEWDNAAEQQFAPIIEDMESQVQAVMRYCIDLDNYNIVLDNLKNKNKFMEGYLEGEFDGMKDYDQVSDNSEKFIFDLLEKDLAEGNNVLLILDQPEDNIDNDNIYKEISNELRQLKIKYNNFQSIIITHNANVAISADSENIIVASEIMKEASKKEFKYESGCIENKKFIERVCDILEGGKKAMERRTTKYGINIIKKVEQNEI